MRIAFVVLIFPTVCETFILNQITGLIDGYSKSLVNEVSAPIELRTRLGSTMRLSSALTMR